MEYWGFHDSEGREEATPAGAENRPAGAECCVGFEHVHLDSRTRTIRFSKPGMGLDLGGIAKGFAIDRAVSIIEEAGVTSTLLHGGTSTIAAVGSPPGEECWKVAVRDPRAGGKGGASSPLAIAHLSGFALSVSAPHGRFIEEGSRLRGHVLDPLLGEPAEGALLAAAASPSAMLADAWATAFLAAGPCRFDELALRASGVTALLLDSEGTVRIAGPRQDIFSME